MTQSGVEPEYSLEEKSARTFPQWDHSRVSNLKYKDQVVAKLRRLSLLHNMQADILDEILGLVPGLPQSQEDT